MIRRQIATLALLLPLALAGCSSDSFGPVAAPLPDCTVWTAHDGAWINGCGQSRAEFVAADYPHGTEVALERYPTPGVTVAIHLWAEWPAEGTPVWSSDFGEWEDVDTLRAERFPDGTVLRFGG